MIIVFVYRVCFRRRRQPIRSICSSGLKIMFLQLIVNSNYFRPTTNLSIKWIPSINRHKLQMIPRRQHCLCAWAKRAGPQRRHLPMVFSAHQCAHSARYAFWIPNLRLFLMKIYRSESQVFIYLAMQRLAASQQRRHNRHDEFSIYRIECLNCVLHFNRRDFRLDGYGVRTVCAHVVRQFD